MLRQPRPAVRRAETGDIPVLVELMRDFYAESNYALDASWAEGAFRSLMADPALGGVWLAHLDGEPAGYVVLSVRFAMEFGAPAGCIDDLYVKPGHRRRGVAAALLDALFEECARRGCKSVSVEVGRDNDAALALYGKYGLAPPGDGRIVLSGPAGPEARARESQFEA